MGLVIFQGMPELQVPALLVSFFTMLMWNGWNKPFKTFSSKFLGISNESCLLFLTCFLYAFLGRSASQKQLTTGGAIMISIVIFTILVNWFFVIIFYTEKLFPKIKAKLKQKRLEGGKSKGSKKPKKIRTSKTVRMISPNKIDRKPFIPRNIPQTKRSLISP